YLRAGGRPLQAWRSRRTAAQGALSAAVRGHRRRHGGAVRQAARLLLPDEDQGVMFVQVLGPAGSTMERTQKTVDAMREKLLTEEGDIVQSVFTVTGFSFAGRGQNAAIAFVGLKPWDER